MTTPVFPGGCLCGHVRYEVTGEPFTYIVCHCHNCQRQSGTAFASNAFFKKENIKVLKGEEYLKAHTDMNTTSGKPLQRIFCTNCGSSVFGQPGQKADIMIVASGSFDDPQRFAARREVFTNMKRPWLGDLKLEPKKAKAKL